MLCCYCQLWRPPGGFNEPGCYVKARLNGVLPTPANPYLKTLASSNWFSPAGDNSKTQKSMQAFLCSFSVH